MISAHRCEHDGYVSNSHNHVTRVCARARITYLSGVADISVINLDQVLV